MLISCCINTYRRPEFLLNLLNSLDKQNIPDGYKLEVIVVDNDQEMTGQVAIEKAKQQANLDLYYFTQPIKNISLTRNKAVEKASGELIMFIDDDGIADPNWVKHMVSCLENYDADGVFGTVLPYYHDDCPDWVKNGNFFDRLIQETGIPSKFMRTGNCLVKASLLKSIPGPFDPRYGLSGGEDSNLFGKLKNNGAHFVFCKEAIVHDYVPLERANLGWLMRRRFRNGTTFVKNTVNRSRVKVITMVFYLFRSILFIFYSAFATLIFLGSKNKRIKWFLKVIAYSGHFAGVFNLTFKEYE
jgi:succinoglycan biosynthesis protein ExoM